MNQVEELEQAILSRAHRLAGEYRERAARSRDEILREAAERLRLRESREEAFARTLAERMFRQRVQASELKMQTYLDRVRWNLVQDIERALQERMHRFMEDQDGYRAWLLDLIRRAAPMIRDAHLHVRANARDRDLLAPHWPELTAGLAKGIGAELVATPITTLGGVLITDAAERIRIDHTYEGRLRRLRPQVQQCILEHLLPGGFDTATLFTG